MGAKARKKTISGAALAEPAPRPRRRLWPYALGIFAALFATFQVYAPVLHGPFIFDDDYLPFRLPYFPQDLKAWVSGVRPLLMFTYWVNFRASGDATLSYHIFNVLFHSVNGVLIFLVVRRLLERAGSELRLANLLAGFGAALFLLHPVQTESVAYVASRSENLSVMFFLAAFAVFLLRRDEAVSWRRAAAVFALFGAALASKEHTLMLPALLLLTDYWWNPGFSFRGIRRNWRLYAPMAIGAALGLAFIWELILRRGDNAGFSIKEFTWYQYFFTQGRALFVYLRLFVLPTGQTLDYDFPISRTPFEHGAIIGLVALAVMTAAAWIWRRRFPLASYGWLAFLILMAPTSSFVPIADPVAERRMYISMIGLLLIVLEFLRRLRVDYRGLAAALAAVAVLYGIAAHRRNYVWTDRIALWEDAVSKTPRKVRPRLQLAYAYYEAQRCPDAVAEYTRAAQLKTPDYGALVNWALALDCINSPDQALEKLRAAAALKNGAHVHSLVGMVYAKRGRWQEALDALAVAEKRDPRYTMLYVYRGGVRMGQGEYAMAAADYRHALALEPDHEIARAALANAEAQLRHTR